MPMSIQRPISYHQEEMMPIAQARPTYKEPIPSRDYPISAYPGMPRRDLTKEEMQLAIHVGQVRTKDHRFPVEFDLDKYIEEYRH